MDCAAVLCIFILSCVYILADATNATDSTPRPLPQPRIIWGEIANRTAAPYHIMVRHNGEYICGGALIEVWGTHIVLTAASCVEDRDANYDVVAGANHRTEFDSNVQIYRVTVIIRHHGYNPRAMHSKDDIAVMRVSGIFNVNSFVQTIRLPRMWQRTSGDGWVSGWGRTWDWGGFSNELRILRVPILPDNECRHSRPSRIFESMLCAGFDTGNSGAPCIGDYGGPLKADNGNYLAGIFSNAWHTSCQDRRNLPIFTKVSHYIDWIENFAAVA